MRQFTYRSNTFTQAPLLVEWSKCLSLQPNTKRRPEIYVKKFVLLVAATLTFSTCFRVSVLNSGKWKIRILLFIMVHLASDRIPLAQCTKLVVRYLIKKQKILQKF